MLVSSNDVYLGKLMSNIFFPKYFATNYILNFLYIKLNEKYFNEKFSLWEIYNNKTKSESTMILCVQ